MKKFEIYSLDQLGLNGKPATIESVLNALWEHHEDYQEDNDTNDIVCTCYLCQSLAPALEQIRRHRVSGRRGGR